MSGATDVWARGIIQQAWAIQHPDRELSQAAAQAIQSIARGESYYGKGWHNCPEGATSHNWGAVQSSLPPCHADAFLCSDTRPQPDGSSKSYAVCFRSYPDDVAGAGDTIRHLTTVRPKTWAVLDGGSAYDISEAMYDEHYYESFGPTREARIANHVKSMMTHATAIANALGEPLLLHPEPGSSGDDSIFDVGGGTGSKVLLVVGGLAGIAIGVGVALAESRGHRR